MKPLLIGLTVYGSHHVKLFLEYAWPSLMAPGNLDALRKERDVGVIIHTDRASAPFLKNIPFPMLDVVATEDKYEQLGRHQNADLKIAKEHGADYHCMMPDYVYSNNCFSGMMAAVNRGHKAIGRLVVSTIEESICPVLKANMSAKDLATLSLKHIHPGIKHWLATEEGYPNTHVIAWEEENTLRMCSPHIHPVYIAHEAIKLSNDNLPLDCMLDKVIEGDIYCPQPEDEICIIEVSPKYSRLEDNKRVDLQEFCRILQVDTKGSSKQLKLFETETVDAIDRQQLGDKYWNKVDIIAQKIMIMSVLKGETHA